MDKKQGKPLKEAEFENLLDKASRPLPEQGRKPDSAPEKTSESPISDSQ